MAAVPPVKFAVRLVKYIISSSGSRKNKEKLTMAILIMILIVVTVQPNKCVLKYKKETSHSVQSGNHNTFVDLLPRVIFRRSSSLEDFIRHA